MSRAVIQNGTHLWSDHFTPTPSSALSFNMEFARAIFNLGNRGSLTDNPHSTKEADVHATNLDDIFIDDLTEFSNEEIGAPISNTDLHFPGFQSCESSSATLISDNTFSFPPANGVEGTNPLGDPQNRNGQKDTIAQLCSGITPELEWLSAFDEDSYSFHGVSNNSFLSVHDQVLLSSPRLYESNRFDKSSSNLYPSDGFGSPACEEQSQFSADAKGFPLEVSVPARARSKRSRSAVRVWSSGVLCRTNSPQGPTSDDQFSDPSVPAGLDFYQDRGAGEAVIDVAEFRSPLKQSLECSSDSKNQWKMLGKFKKGQDSGQARRCAHCLSQKTPQWRQGPTGPKTLCNACGVRFKSGRLFPEYRPAKSPTFLTQIHSNSHKKVLEMRRQRLTAQTSQQKQEQEQRKVRLKLPEEIIQIPLQGEVNQIRRTQEQGGFQYEH